MTGLSEYSIKLIAEELAKNHRHKLQGEKGINGRDGLTSDVVQKIFQYIQQLENRIQTLENKIDEMNNINHALGVCSKSSSEDSPEILC
jgi:hypothetical protein